MGLRLLVKFDRALRVQAQVPLIQVALLQAKQVLQLLALNIVCILTDRVEHILPMPVAQGNYHTMN